MGTDPDDPGVIDADRVDQIAAQASGHFRLMPVYGELSGCWFQMVQAGRKGAQPQSPLRIFRHNPVLDRAHCTRPVDPEALGTRVESVKPVHRSSPQNALAIDEQARHIVLA